MKNRAWDRNGSEIVEQGNKVRIEQIRGGITQRLKKSCSHLREEEFVALVDEMSKIQLGGENRST